MNSKNKVDLKLDWCSHEAAKYACEHWHYSKTIPVGKIVKVGVWENEQFIGCILFSRGASPYLGKLYRLTQCEICELTRIALSSHLCSVSRMISIAIKMLKNINPGIRLIVSFADKNFGHHGGIYQASNWVYSGETNKKFDYIGPDGKRYKDRQVTKDGVVKQFGRVTKSFKISECDSVLQQPKYRYLYPLDADMKKQIETLRKPYPKRAGSADGGTSGIPA